MTAGARYQVSAWTRVAVGLEQMNLVLRTKCQNDSAYFFFVLDFDMVGATWSQRLAEFDAPTCTLESLEIYVEGPPGGTDFYVDDVALIPVE